MAGRPRKPTQLHIISGSAANHPERMRQRKNEPVLEGSDLRDSLPPPHLADNLAAIWNDLRRMLHAGVAGASDKLAFEALVRATAKCRGRDATPAWFARQTALMGEFGMTPFTRSKVSRIRKTTDATGFGALKAARTIEQK